ncbi:MAG: ABC transporter transmembrane domain-containing protein [Eubacteriales bacterium]
MIANRKPSSSRLSDETLAVMRNDGIDFDSRIAWAISDRNVQGAYHQTVVILTESEIILFCQNDEPRTVRYPVSDFLELRVEELISGCRLIGKSAQGDKLLSCMSFSCKDNFYKICSVFEHLTHGQSYEKEEPEEVYCPKCGMRYADNSRKFCPNCTDHSKVLSRMSVFFLKYRMEMALIFLTLVVLGGLAVIAPYLSSGFYYDEVLSADGNFFGQIIFVLTLIIALRLLRIGVQMVSDIISTRITAKLVYDIKKTSFHAIEKLSVSYFTSRSTGSLMNQVNSDADRIYWFFVDGLPVLLINAIQFIVVLIVMLIMNPLLTLLALIMVPLVLVLMGKLYNHNRRLHAKRYSKERALNGLLSDLLNGIRVVKSFAGEKIEAARFNQYNSRFAEAAKKTSLYGATAFPMVNVLVYLGVIIIWAVGGWMIITDSFDFTYGMLLTFVSYMGMIYDPIYSMIGMMQTASESMNAMSRLLEIMDAVPEVAESEHPVPMPECKGQVTFKDVKFSYIKNRTVLDGISFDIEAGGNIGIVGHTGAGKSTIANLLIRLYDVDEGEILVDGINVKDLSFKDLHKSIAIVSQETYLFVGTILDNIRYSNPDATREEVIRAAKAAGAHDFICKLSDGYETMVGFGYKELSGGERQRVSIARALLQDPKILILDEATAAMDTQTEQKIQNTLDELSKGRTTITIAHRLSTLRNADYLIVIKDRKMAEYGTPAELIKKKGLYWNLYRLQLEALKNAGIAE